MQLEQCLVLLCIKIDWQLESSISEMHFAILWAIAFFGGEQGGIPAAKVKSYPQSCGVIMLKK